MPLDLENRRTALYRFYDADGCLLYVGITHDIEERWAQHAHYKTWWLDAVRHTVDWFGTRTPAHTAEVVAIRDEKPIYNGPARGGGDWRKRTRPVRAADAAEIQEALRRVREDIATGVYQPGQNLPPVTKLSDIYGLAPAIIGGALSELSRQHLLEAGTRYRVAGGPPRMPKQRSTSVVDVSEAWERY